MVVTDPVAFVRVLHTDNRRSLDGSCVIFLGNGAGIRGISKVGASSSVVSDVSMSASGRSGTAS